MKHRRIEILRTGMLVLSAALFAALVWVLWRTIPWSAVRYGILGLCAAIFAVVGLWAWYQRRQVSLFADDLCETLDALLSGRQPENYQPYEDSLTAKVQGKLMQYFDIMSEGKRQSQQDKQVIQSLVSDISHQVKTPIANIKMFTNILRRPLREGVGRNPPSPPPCPHLVPVALYARAWVEISPLSTL